jgi:hypothetical protein
VQSEFTRLPDDLRAFAEEAHRFCEDDTETDEILAGLKESNFMHLWWD